MYCDMTLVIVLSHRLGRHGVHELKVAQQQVSVGHIIELPVEEIESIFNKLIFNISILSRYLSNRSCVWGLGVIGQDAPR